MKKIVIHEQGGHIVGWHDLHDCTCFVCRGPAEHRIVNNGYEDIECMQGCGLVWLRGEPSDLSYFIDKRPDKRKSPCDRCARTGNPLSLRCRTAKRAFSLLSKILIDSET